MDRLSISGVLEGSDAIQFFSRITTRESVFLVFKKKEGEIPEYFVEVSTNKEARKIIEIFNALNVNE